MLPIGVETTHNSLTHQIRVIQKRPHKRVEVAPEVGIGPLLLVGGLLLAQLGIDHLFHLGDSSALVLILDFPEKLFDQIGLFLLLPENPDLLGQWVVIRHRLAHILVVLHRLRFVHHLHGHPQKLLHLDIEIVVVFEE